MPRTIPVKTIIPVLAPITWHKPWYSVATHERDVIGCRLKIGNIKLWHVKKLNEYFYVLHLCVCGGGGGARAPKLPGLNAMCKVVSDHISVKRFSTEIPHAPPCPPRLL